MIHIGLCGWDSRSLFEPGIRASDKLEIYSNIYSAVEVNSTFYHFPSPATIETWHATVPQDFRFSIKLNRLFSHDTGLQLDPATADRLREFLTAFFPLQDKLSWFLLQLPPSQAADRVALEGYLSLMRRILAGGSGPCGIAVEFRHASWYHDDSAAILRAYDATQVISSSPGLWPCVWQRQMPADYIRLHGLKKMYHTSYTAAELDGLKQWLDDSPAADSWVWFDNTATSGARNNSQYLMDRFGQAIPEQTRQLSMLDLVSPPEQSLFLHDEDE